MRIDKYLKLSRIIKRRTIAKEACQSGKVYINDVEASPSSTVKENDFLKVRFGSKCMNVKVLSVNEHVRKNEAQTMYEVISQECLSNSCE